MCQFHKQSILLDYFFSSPVKRKHTDSKDFIGCVSHSADCRHNATLNHNLSIALVAYPDKDPSKIFLKV